jgi:hypothetical protein
MDIWTVSYYPNRIASKIVRKSNWQGKYHA